jgi:predicted CoA-binding protein
MSAAHESFWTNASFAVAGHSAKKPFPKISYGELKRNGKKVFAVDPSVEQIDGDETYRDLASLPEKVDAVVLEVPKEETAELVRQAADAGIQNVWIHMARETPEALELAKQRGLNVLTGSCAVMYVKQGFSYHSIHKWVNKLIGKY